MPGPLMAIIITILGWFATTPLDSGGINGVVVTDYEEEVNQAIVVQNDGKIIVAGRTQNSVSEKKFLLVRYTDMAT